MKIFLTGGTGFIGQSLAEALVARGWSVVALVRKPDSPAAFALTKIGAQCVNGDVTNRESMRVGMSGADIVIHNAGWYEIGISNSAQKLMHDINVTGTENVLSLALELSIPRTLYVSTYGFFGDSGSETRNEMYRQKSPTFPVYYEQSKYEAHEIALRFQERGLPLIIVCPGHVVGPNDHSAYGYFQRLYVNRLMPPFAWAPNTVHSPVHVRDVAEGIALATEKGTLGETYILAGEPTSLRRLFEIWATQPGGFPVRFYMPFWLAELMFAPMEPILRWLDLPAFLSREVVWVCKGSRSYSSSKAQHALGWTHRTANEMWISILEDERKLLSARGKRGLLSRLKPVQMEK